MNRQSFFVPFYISFISHQKLLTVHKQVKLQGLYHKSDRGVENLSKAKRSVPAAAETLTKPLTGYPQSSSLTEETLGEFRLRTAMMAVTLST